MSQLQLGTILDGLYRVDRRLGVGGVGAVYEAWHLNLGRAVAVKVLHPQFAGHQEPLQRFIREAQLLSKLGHPSFVNVYDFSYTPEGMPYLVMELIDGETLRARLSRGPMPVNEVLSLFKPLCEALGQAHQLNILHRDLKPDNLMLVPGGIVKLLDFGMAKLMSDEIPLTAEKVVMGTPYYMAPERARGQRDIDARSDIFSLGAILYECLIGRMAFAAETPLAAMYRIIRDPVPPLEFEDRVLSERLDRVIAKACSKATGGRYGSMMEFSTALQTVAESQQPAATATVPPADSAVRGEKQGMAKAAVFHGAMHFIRSRFGEDGFLRVSHLFGVERMERIMRSLPSDLISTNDLHDSNMAISQLFDDGTLKVFRELGRYHAEMLLESIYKALLIPGDPETVLRRSQVIFTTTAPSSQSRVERIDEHRWRLEFRSIEGLTPHWIAGMAGWMQCYLEKVGARATVSEEICDEDGLPVGILTFSLDVSAIDPLSSAAR